MTIRVLPQDHAARSITHPLFPAYNPDLIGGEDLAGAGGDDGDGGVVVARQNVWQG